MTQKRKSDWLKKGPMLPQLIERVKDERDRRRNKTAIIIPTYLKNELLQEHLARLARQSHREFDVIIIYGEKDEFLDDACGHSAVHIRRSVDCGSAGAFYIGEKYALSEGYENVILADNDCLPVSRTLVRELVRSIENGADVAMPRISEDGAIFTNFVIAQYGCIRAEALKKIGFSYLPFYFGGEDLELLDRLLKHGYPFVVIDEVASHPALRGMSILVRPPLKLFYYIRGGILRTYLKNGYREAFWHTFRRAMETAFFAPFNRGLTMNILKALFKASSMTFFSAGTEFEDYRNAVSPAVVDGTVFSKDAEGEAGDKPSRPAWGGGLRAVLVGLSRMPAFLGKGVVFENEVRLSGVPALLAARRSWIKHDGRYYEISGNNPYPHFPIFLIYLLLATPFAFLLSLGLTFSGFVRKTVSGISTYRYGL
jgi:GT2 family glycosyltransferase